MSQPIIADIQGWIKENSPGGWIDNLRVEISQLRADNARLVGEVELASASILNYASDLQRHREALEVAKVAIQFLSTPPTLNSTRAAHEYLTKRDSVVSGALATINEVLK